MASVKLTQNFLRSKAVPVWRVQVLDDRGYCIHAEERMWFDDAQRAVERWCAEHGHEPTEVEFLG